jgi:hypothetical protein
MSRTTARPLYALALVAAPLLIGAASLVDITPETETTEELLTLIAERPTAWSAGQLLFFLSGVLWVPAGLALLRIVGTRTLGRVGALAVLIGGAAILPVDAAGLYLRELATSGVPLAEQVDIVEGVDGSAPVLAFEVVHVVGLFGGLLVLALGLLRARIAPVWTPVVLLVALAGLLAAPHRIVETVAMALLVVAFGALAGRLLRMGDDEWQTGAARPPAVTLA